MDMPGANPIQDLMQSLISQQASPAPALPAAPPAGLFGPPASPPPQSGAGLLGAAPAAPAPNLWGAPAPQADTTMAPVAPASPLAITAPDSTGQPTGILAKIGKLIDGGASRVGNALMPGPSAGLQQFITPDQTKNARAQAILAAGLQLMKSSSPTDMSHPAATTLGALGAAGQTAQAAYQDAIQRPIQLGQEAYAIREQQRKALARQAITAQYSAPAGETIPQTAQRLAQMGAAFSANGLTDEAKAMSESAAGLARGLNPQQEKPENYIPVTTQDGQVHVVNKNTGEDMGPLKSGPAAPDKNAGKVQGSQLEQLQHDYQGVSKPYSQSVSAYNELQGLLDAGAPPATTIAAYARFINPGRAASAGVMGVLGDMGNVGQQLQNWYSKKGTGALDPQIINMIRTSADGSMAQLREQNRNDIESTVSRGAALGLPTARVRGSLSVPKVTLYRERTGGTVAPGRVTPFGVTQ